MSLLELETNLREAGITEKGSFAALSLYLTHWTPRCGNSTVMSSLLQYTVHTPFLQPSRPTLAGLTRLCGCVFGTSESCVTQLKRNIIRATNKGSQS